MMVYHLKAAAADNDRDWGNKSKNGVVESSSCSFLAVLLSMLLSALCL